MVIVQSDWTMIGLEPEADSQRTPMGHQINDDCDSASGSGPSGQPTLRPGGRRIRRVRPQVAVPALSNVGASWQTGSTDARSLP